ncbi:glycosyltransferase BC10 [Trifolium pratense]|uniref:glycosyltransferase BC10 n=1 Tax=Trifolium pratense TaxID=57577 RepID=UPI001E6924B1|nr:glycosyltransferase BC10 [Trifolium pratense]
MLSPKPLSLLCALLLSLPLVILFTTTTTITITTITTTFYSTIHTPKKSNPNQTTTYLSTTKDEDEDETLFIVANQTKQKPTWPRKLAFMFLTTTPLSFASLWESYFNQIPKNLFNIYIHADPTFSYDPPFSGIFSNRLIPSKPTARFSPTLTAAARRLLARALIDDSSNYIFILLSSSCIPLHSFNFTYQTLINSNKSFIEILNNETGSHDRWAARGPHTMLPTVKFEDFRVGSQFWALTRKHARLVVSDGQIWPKFYIPCVRYDMCYPEENYFPTLINMWDPEGSVNATLTHVDWKGRHDGHPRTYVASEICPELIWALRRDRPRYGNENVHGDSVGGILRRRDLFLFARKFSPDCLQPLMEMADSVIFHD